MLQEMDLVDFTVVEKVRLQLLEVSEELQQLETEDRKQDFELTELKECQADFQAAVLEVEVLTTNRANNRRPNC